MTLFVIGVRHHSPACARWVEASIARLRPRFVLIEGPSDMNERIDEFGLSHQLPIALFTYCRDLAGASRGTWGPYCEYSPEWVALSAARRMGATALFIDLPAWHAAFSEQENRYSDRHFLHSSRLQELCARFGFEDTDSLWDHLFEQPDPDGTLGERLARYFVALRGDEPAGPRDEPREEFMCRYVAWAMAQAGTEPVLVVCGGYHQPFIESAWQSYPAERPFAEPPTDARIGSYLVPFSFRRLDSFSGYASGMPSPEFYQRVWTEGHAQAPEGMLFDAILHLRKAKQRVSPADAIAAATLSRALCNLRGHQTACRVDVLDGLAGALVKDALSVPLPWTQRATMSHRTDPLLVELLAAFSGQRVGILAPSTPLPPILQDVFTELARVGLDFGREPQKHTLSLVEPQGSEQSAILHRLRVLQIPGIVLKRAPSLHRSKTSLTEEWSLAHRLETEPALIEAALYGATLESAAVAAIEDRSRSADNILGLAEALYDAARCRIHALTARSLRDIAARIAEEPSFSLLGGALLRLLALYRGDVVLHAEDPTELETVLVACFERGLWLLEGLTGPSAPLDLELVRAVVALRDTLRATENRCTLDVARARAVCQRRTADPGAPPCIRGAALGLLWSTAPLDPSPTDFDHDRVARALGAMSKPSYFGDFLAGLFALARERVVSTPELVDVIDSVVSAYSPEDFLIALPALRQAFVYFPPRERLRIAELVLGHSEQEVVDPMQLLGATVDLPNLQRAAHLERQALNLARRFGLATVREPRP